MENKLIAKTRKCLKKNDLRIPGQAHIIDASLGLRILIPVGSPTQGTMFLLGLERFLGFGM